MHLLHFAHHQEHLLKLKSTSHSQSPVTRASYPRKTPPSLAAKKPPPLNAAPASSTKTPLSLPPDKIYPETQHHPKHLLLAVTPHLTTTKEPPKDRVSLNIISKFLL
ncbi:hypothetical protein M758_1G020100 [Ceratodon purpureus]|nr:hypothetical protein M758_1G020100 [Ceratodon purpureus]